MAYEVVLKLRSQSGAVKQWYLNGDDTDTHSCTFDDGSEQTNVDSTGGVWYLIDAIFSGSPTNITKLKINVNGMDTGYRIIASLNQASNQSRQFTGAPIGFKAGSSVRFIQSA